MGEKTVSHLEKITNSTQKKNEIVENTREQKISTSQKEPNHEKKVLEEHIRNTQQKQSRSKRKIERGTLHFNKHQ